MKSIIYSLLLTCALNFAIAQRPNQSRDRLPKAMLSVKVTGEDGLPIRDADVEISFPYFRWDGPEIANTKGKSDGNGVFAASATSENSVSYGAVLDGYYKSRGEYKYPLDAHRAGRWEPWNPNIELILKRIINPVPMYARKLRIEMPLADASLGFDLVESDWVAPHGRGKVVDFVFHLSRRFESWKDYYAEVKLAFSNEGDGIQAIPSLVQSGSELKLPRLAPKEGYLGEITTAIGRAPSTLGRDDGKSGRSYFFRVRTVRDEKREIISALYGKIDGDIRVDVINSKTALLLFNYYLNPESKSRNMEFDPKRNLFGELKSTEQVSNP
jgi:hypothetical protein